MEHVKDQKGYTLAGTVSSIGTKLLVKLDTAEDKVVLGTDNCDAVARTNYALSATQVSAGRTELTCSMLNGGGVLELVASEAITIGTRVVPAANGKVRAIDVNATPVDQNTVGIAQKAAGADGDIIPVYIDKQVVNS